MKTKHVISISSSVVPSAWELALALKLILTEAGGEAEVLESSGSIQVIATCDPEQIRRGVETAILAGE